MLKGLAGTSPDPELLSAALEQSWVPGTETERHNRKWKLSTRHDLDDLHWSGHIGFVREGHVTTTGWDDEAKEFVRGEAPSGVIVPFVVDLEASVVTFQLFPGEVKQRTVTSNLAALLNVEGTYTWSLEIISLSRSFAEWRTSVGRVISVAAGLEYPNPNWTGRDKLEDLIDGLKADTLRLRAKALEDDSLDTDGDWFTELLNHVRLGYGRTETSGVDLETGQVSRHVETPEGGSIPMIYRIAAEEGANEASFDELRAAQVELIQSQADDMVVIDDPEGLEDDEPDYS